MHYRLTNHFTTKRALCNVALPPSYWLQGSIYRSGTVIADQVRNPEVMLGGRHSPRKRESTGGAYRHSGLDPESGPVQDPSFPAEAGIHRVARTVILDLIQNPQGGINTTQSKARNLILYPIYFAH